MGTGVITGNVRALGVADITISPALVAANTTAEQTFTVPGLLASDVVHSVSKPAAQAGLGIVGWRVTTAGLLAVTFSNNTASGITPTASEVYRVSWMRPELTSAGVYGA